MFIVNVIGICSEFDCGQENFGSFDFAMGWLVGRAKANVPKCAAGGFGKA